MNKIFSVAAVSILLGLGAMGCSNTEEGVSKDANAVGQKVAQGTENAGQAVKTAGTDAANATRNAAENAAAATKNAANATKNAAENAATATKDAAHNAANATRNAAENVGDAASAAAANAGHKVKEAGKDTAENLDVRPKVKLAITADRELNNTSNVIAVEPKDGVVHLRGHVLSDAMKTKAANITQNVLKNMHSSDTIQNELTVKGP